MPTSVDVTNLKINQLTEAQYDTAVQGGVIGANELSVLTDVSDAIQVSSMPTASADELGNIYQYTGTTDVNYTNGYFYKCVSDGQNPATYSWTRLDVQPTVNPLPSQTGNAGKFLTTDGTDASWSRSIAGILDINNTSGGHSININGDNSSQNSFFRKVITGIGICYGANNVYTRDFFFHHSTADGGYFAPLNWESGKIVTLGTSSAKWANLYTTKINNGANITVPTVGGTLALQIATMPTAGSTYEGMIYQFTGTTDSTYTNGHFYKCVSDGQTPATYSWEEVQLGGGGSSLPSQTGNAGKFLTTNGTDASWGNALANTATHATTALTLLGTANTTSNGINIGERSTVTGNAALALGSRTEAVANSVSIGPDAKTKASFGVSVGLYCESESGVALGVASKSKDSGIAVGNNAYATASNFSIQLGKGTNTDSGTFKIGTTTDGTNWNNYEMLSADGTIPTDRFTTTPSADGNYIPVVNLASGTATRSWSSIASALTTLPGYDATKTQTLKNVAGTLSWVDD